MPAGMGHPQPPWATCSVRHHPLGEKLPPHIQPKPPLSQCKTIPPCPIAVHPCVDRMDGSLRVVVLIVMAVLSVLHLKPKLPSIAHAALYTNQSSNFFIFC